MYIYASISLRLVGWLRMLCLLHRLFCFDVDEWTVKACCPHKIELSRNPGNGSHDPKTGPSVIDEDDHWIVKDGNLQRILKKACMMYFQIYAIKGEPQPLGTLRAWPGLCGDCFSLPLWGVKSVSNKAKNVGCISSSQPLYQDVIYCRHGLRSAGLYMKIL
jgi:hypothetical protein